MTTCPACESVEICAKCARRTIHTIEHVPDPEKAYAEMRRVLRGGGLLYLYPAWQCPAWLADQYPIRPYSDFTLKGKLIKWAIPIRDHTLYRAIFKIPFRICRLMQHRLTRKPTRLFYRELAANFENNRIPDDDAVNQLDPAEAILWFESRGDRCLTNPTLKSQILARNAPVIIQKAS